MSDKKKKFKRPRRSSGDSSSSTSSSCTSSSWFSDEETDARDLKPIKEYLSNRKELAAQLFKSVRPEKIRMMLPQILKKMEFKDLEEWCASELSGMSKKRVMCIINGQEMLQSSDTDESNSTGPSLEIISDTEELLTDNEVAVKEEGAKKKKKKVTQDPKLAAVKGTIKPKAKVKKEGKNVKVKIEKVKSQPKEKEEESLLDLLELEMRARAIRALIRKEENVIPNAASDAGTSSDKTSANASLSGNKTISERQANLRKQLEKIDVLIKHGEDEDVLVVVNEAPTIELLSSDSDQEEQGKRVNQRLDNERSSSQAEKSLESEKMTTKETPADSTLDEKEKCNEAVSNVEPVQVVSIAATSSEIKIVEELEEGELSNNGDDIEDDKLLVKDEMSFPVKKKIKKKKKTLRGKVKSNKTDEIKKPNGKDNDTQIHQEANDVTANGKSKSMNDKVHEIKNDNVTAVECITSLENVKTKQKSKCEPSFDEKSSELDAVIDLDDYPDDYDMYEVDSKSKSTSLTEIHSDIDMTKNSSHTETWASRYYATDDVQNVIKESKIQSEIRKRLRERQRMGKLNNSPNLLQNTLQASKNVDAVHTLSKPTGSVEEYLALKGLATTGTEGNSEETSTSDSITSQKLTLDEPLSVDHVDKISSKEKEENDTNECLLPNTNISELRPD